MNRCGCNPIPEPFEFPVESNVLKISNFKPFKLEQNLNKLKGEIICDFLEIINKLECGIQIDLEFLLLNISKVYISELNKLETYLKPITYIGFDTEEDINNLLYSKFIQKSAESEISVKVRNDVYGSYLWIVTPYTLEAVATDSEFRYKMNVSHIGYLNNLHYYKSNSKVDICNLTYYIK